MARATVRVEGFVSQDPEVHTTQGGKQVVSVSVPFQRSRRREDGSWENVGATTWFEASFWEADAVEVQANVSKGTVVLLEGVPEVDVYQRRDGATAAKVRLHSPVLGVVPRARRGQQAPQESQGWATAETGQAWGEAPAAQAPSFSDETPF